jgi:hypothetical protein
LPGVTNVKAWGGNKDDMLMRRASYTKDSTREFSFEDV